MDYELLFQRLKDLREDNDLTQEEMANVLGVSQSNYARWEVKIKIIPLNKLNEFCNYFHVNMDYVIGLTNKREYIESCCIDKKIIAERLKSFRKKNKVTQVQLAKQLGTDYSVISAYEKEKTLIFTAFLVDICIRYKISADWICGRKKIDICFFSKYLFSIFYFLYIEKIIYINYTIIIIIHNFNT